MTTEEKMYKGLPQVNMNGSDKRDLIEQQEDVFCAARLLLERLAKARPHGRDYQSYFDHTGVLNRALARHEECVQAVQAVKDRAAEVLASLHD